MQRLGHRAGVRQGNPEVAPTGARRFVDRAVLQGNLPQPFVARGENANARRCIQLPESGLVTRDGAKQATEVFSPPGRDGLASVRPEAFHVARETPGIPLAKGA